MNPMELCIAGYAAMFAMLVAAVSIRLECGWHMRRLRATSGLVGPALEALCQDEPRSERFARLEVERALRTAQAKPHPILDVTGQVLREPVAAEDDGILQVWIRRALRPILMMRVRMERIRITATLGAFLGSVAGVMLGANELSHSGDQRRMMTHIALAMGMTFLGTVTAVLAGWWNRGIAERLVEDSRLRAQETTFRTRLLLRLGHQADLRHEESRGKGSITLEGRDQDCHPIIPRTGIRLEEPSLSGSGNNGQGESR